MMNIKQDKYEMLNLQKFVSSLRHYKKDSIVDNGLLLLWDTFRHKEKYKPEIIQVINSYAPKLIILALATANNCRSSELSSTSFYNLCHDYLGIKSPIGDHSFINSESNQLIESLKKLSVNKNNIPEIYLNHEIIKEACLSIFISRTVRQQHEGFLARLNEFYMTLDVLVRLNEYSKGQLNVGFKETFGVDPLHFIRDVLGIFTLSNTTNNGKILFKGLGPVDNSSSHSWNSCHPEQSEGSCLISRRSFTTFRMTTLHKMESFHELSTDPNFS